MAPKRPPSKPSSPSGRLTQARAEKISAVEGLTLTSRMRDVLAATKDQPADERRRAIRAQFVRPNA